MTAERRERIVIVGTGAAGLRAAERLRELNFDGELVMISEEPYRPYHRPALCKQLLTGSVRPRDIVQPVHTDLDAVWRYATRATRLDPDEHVVHLPGGEELRYDGLVIATGVAAKHLPGAPRHDPRVQVLRTIADAAAVKRAMAHSRGEVAVIGGGFVSCEVASSARELGRDVTMVVRDRTLLDRVPGAGFGAAVEGIQRGHGVQVLTETTVRHWTPHADGISLHLSSGRVVLAACVVLGVGGVPVVDWLRGSGLILDDGVMCDPTCHAIGAPDIVVAGDVARWPNLRFDTVPRRVEHWLNAIEMGRAAAENLLLGPGDAAPFTPLPRFWSDQHGIRIQAAGIPALAQDTVPLAGSVTVGHRVTGYVSGGNLVGIVAWDSPRGMLRWSAELDEQLNAAMRKRIADRPRPAVASAVDLTAITNLEIPDYVPDMASLGPAEQSVPRMRPVEPPREPAMSMMAASASQASARVTGPAGRRGTGPVPPAGPPPRPPALRADPRAARSPQPPAGPRFAGPTPPARQGNHLGAGPMDPPARAANPRAAGPAHPTGQPVAPPAARRENPRAGRAA
ncbi:MAG: NAD(P)/FAD-dependent oxidoreductase, partial [Labedaea sp.]